MNNEPIFELFPDPEFPERQLVRIYVHFNGQRMTLIDALKAVETQTQITRSIELFNWHERKKIPPATLLNHYGVRKYS